MALFQIQQKIQECNFFSNRIVIYLSLILLYILRNGPSLFLIKNSNNIAFPLQSIYTINIFFQSGWDIAPGLIDSIISPSNAVLIVPPGIYILIKILSLTSVFKIFLFNFLIQLVVPIVFYELLRTKTSSTNAFFVAVFAVLFMTDAGWWASDFIIQCLMLPIFFIFVYNEGAYLKDYRLVLILGILSGFIILLKQNIGIFFVIVCATILLLRCIQPNIPDTKRNRINNLFTCFIFLGFLVFGLFFGLRLPHADELVFYLVPFFIFLLFLWRYLKGSDQSFSLHDSLVTLIPFGLGAIILPLSVFCWLGSKIGFVKYAFSLFGMGFQYILIWDHGIIGIIRQNFNPLGSISSLFFSPIWLLMYIFPFIVNSFAIYWIYRQSKGQSYSHNPAFFLPYKYAAVGVMSIFMFFPLEGNHILETKIFIFIFIFFALMNLSAPLYSESFSRIIALLGTLTICVIVITFFSVLSVPSNPGGPELKTVIEIPLSNSLASELQAQVTVLNRSVHGEPYYIVDGSGGGLIYLAALVPNRYSQYYIEMRPGIMNDAVAQRIIQEASGLDYVVVRSEDYFNSPDPQMVTIINYLKKNYVVKDTYPPSVPDGDADTKFIILERKT